jgi:hypothetical protein
VRRTVVSLVTTLCLALLSVAQEKNIFLSEVTHSRFPIAVHDGKLTGEGAAVLQQATQGTQFLLLGEDHGISQIPEFAGGLFAMVAPQGFNTLNLEVGPEIGAQLQRMAAEPDGGTQLADFEKRYPFSIAFYDWQQELEFLLRSARVASGGLTIWGLDQELMGAGGFLLRQILAENPGPEAKSYLQQMLAENDRDYASAAKSGNPGDLFMMAVKETDLARLKEVVDREGNARAQRLVRSMIESRDIYQKNMKHENYESNRRRAQLMKANFVNNFESAASSGKPPKIMLKFGAWHMYRGLNPMDSSELGNMLNEICEEHSWKMVNVLILGVKGEQLHFAGIGRPPQPVPLDLKGDKDSDYRFLSPFFDAMPGDDLTLFDLRNFRAKFRTYGKLDPEMERLVFGYDFLVLIPRPRAAAPVTP